jgi:hypothetical protein
MSRGLRLSLTALGLALAMEAGCICGLLFFLGAERLALSERGAPADARPSTSGQPSLVQNLPASPLAQTPATATPSPLVPDHGPQAPTPTSTRVIPLTTSTPTSSAPTPISSPTSTPLPGPTLACRRSSDTEGLANLIIVIWDGTQRAHLQEMLTSSRLPNLQALAQANGGLFLPFIRSATCQPGGGDGYRTETGPANSAIATGLGYPGMANWQNSEPHPIPDGLTLWEWFDARGYVTGIISSKDQDFWPHSPLRNARPEIEYWKVGAEPQTWVTDTALKFLSDYAPCRFFVWVHYKEPDTLGHQFGENSAQYSASLEVNDQQLARLIDGLREHSIEGSTLLIVTTDHGFDENGLQHETCTPDTKGLFLATSHRMGGLRSCIKDQTDLAPCIKASVAW